jgi:uridine kinase
LPGDRAATSAADVLAHAVGRPPTLGSGRLICIDGPAGAGKTTLAGQVGNAGGALVVHLDDLYPGWDGLFDVDRRVLELIGPLADGLTGYYRRWDWTDSEYRETHHVDPADLLVLEGVGSGNRAWSDLVTTLVWVEAPPDVCLTRGLERDGEDQRELWQKWKRDEQRLFTEQGTRARADLVVAT